jgi:UDP-N-acetylglucosamine 2-epimerase (non-hydrolysing)
MPEEVNRVVTDHIADLLFTTSPDANENLLRERIHGTKLHFVGNTMIDTLDRLLPKAGNSRPAGMPERFVLVNLHRPSNVDEPGMLRRIIETLEEISRKLEVVFPVHPRTRARLSEFGLTQSALSCLRLLEPLSYLEFLSLQMHATAVVTDSGGIQEETTVLGVPCLTLRANTERPITITMGTNILIGTDPARLHSEVDRILRGQRKAAKVPPLWDGHAGERIADVLARAGQGYAAARECASAGLD